jgi:hypothetical protein
LHLISRFVTRLHKPPLFRRKHVVDPLLDGFNSVLSAFCVQRLYRLSHRIGLQRSAKTITLAPSLTGSSAEAQFRQL